MHLYYYKSVCLFRYFPRELRNSRGPDLRNSYTPKLQNNEIPEQPYYGAPDFRNSRIPFQSEDNVITLLHSSKVWKKGF
ncbi:MAG TPA: hypothetical protein PL101_09430 [Bacteroidales bacterium]|nr:hypothetical protein [Bacteroidales bacterium]